MLDDEEDDVEEFAPSWPAMMLHDAVDAVEDDKRIASFGDCAAVEFSHSFLIALHFVLLSENELR